MMSILFIFAIIIQIQVSPELAFTNAIKLLDHHDPHHSIFKLPPKSLIGMIHVKALPGTPYYNRRHFAIDSTALHAANEAVLLYRAGFDAVLIENMFDRPYMMRNVGPEIVASMTKIVIAVQQALSNEYSRGNSNKTIPVGIQILAGCNREAVAVAAAGGAQFIRAEGFAYASVADEGLMAKASAGDLLRYRRLIDAEHIAIYADVKKKHSSHAITADVGYADMSHGFEFFGADGVIVTGMATGDPANPNNVKIVSDSVKGRIVTLVGSGITPDNLKDYYDFADGFIVGSYLKEDGDWTRALDGNRMAKIVAAMKQLRKI